MKISFISSDSIVCPVCKYELYREELHSGRGRIVVDKFTDELRHTYKPSEKYGIVNPLLYPITVCPNCRYAAFKTDFTRINSATINQIKRTEHERTSALANVCPQLDFLKPRELPEGIASYYYALLCYQYWPAETGTTIRQGLAALRIAWLCCDFHAQEMNANWDAMARIFYRKARYFYRLAWEQDQSNEQPLASDFNLGPDTDKNYGIEGVCYLASYLELHWGPTHDTKIRRERLQEVRTRIAHMFNPQQNRQVIPGIILSNAHSMHAAIGERLAELQ